MQNSVIRHVELFSGSANPAEARVYVVVTLVEKHQHELKQFKLSGHLTGPECKFAHTLPARIPFMDRGSDGTLLAEAIVPDPCFWTPELPFLYRAELQLNSHQSVVERRDGIVGIRRLGVRGRELYFEGKRFVLRGIGAHFDSKDPSESDMAFLRQSWTAAMVSWPDTTFCKLASQCGMLLIADLRTSGTEANHNTAAGTVRSVAQWPAVVMAIVDAQTFPLIDVRGAVKNLLIGQYVCAEEWPPVDPKAQIIFAEIGDLSDLARRIGNCDRPIIAVRRLAQPAKIDQARAACDVLQGDLAKYGDFAGYVV
jgi:hypothetical protein